MGVFHFMGLGRSPGAVTAAISYLAERYERWNDADQVFFGTSGEYGQESKRGDVQALILFTTPEIYHEEKTGLSDLYINNKPGYVGTDSYHSQPIPSLLKKRLPEHLRRVAGNRKEMSLYWCECDRANIYVTFERVLRVMNAAHPPGRIGKEIWVNLTGGSNIINIALQMAAALLGSTARLYYLVSKNDHCLWHTTPLNDIGTERDSFWVDIPLINMSFNPKTRVILELLENIGLAVMDNDLYSRLKSSAIEFSDLDLVDTLRRDYLRPMEGQGLIERDKNNEHCITIGQQWKALKNFYKIYEELRPSIITESTAETNLGFLTKNRDWFHEDKINL